MKRACQQAKRTRYGLPQHLTAEHKNELGSSTGFMIDTVQLVNDIYSTEIQLLVIKFKYQNSQGRVGEAWTYPGNIKLGDDGLRWRPDEQLDSWLTKMTQSQTTGWNNPRECIKELRESIKIS